jgi:hypothetical protein
VLNLARREVLKLAPALKADPPSADWIGFATHERITAGFLHTLDCKTIKANLT